MANTIVMAIFPVTLAPPGKKGDVYKRQTEHHSLQCLAAAQSHIGLPMRKGGTGINHGTFKRQSLAFVNGNRPRQLQRILPECSFNIFMNALELLVAFIQAYVFTMLSAVFIEMCIRDRAINKCLPAFVYNVQISLKLFMYM